MKKPTNSFIVGAVALVFAILGYQSALLVHYAATAKIVANRDRPDTIYIYSDGSGGDSHNGGRNTAVRHNSTHATYAQKVRGNVRPANKSRSDRTRGALYPPFRFNPNTASIEDLMRLGFSQKQAESIDAYRRKGGRFRRREDFAKSYVVSDSLYRRLERFIDIPLLDLNAADSAAFDSLPGIGGYFASKMVAYRAKLGGYSYPEQLMDIYHFDSLKFNALRDLITISPPSPYRLWTLSTDSLSLHPYIGKNARGIVFFRDHNPRSKWTVEGLAAAGVISANDARRLSRCCIQDP